MRIEGSDYYAIVPIHGIEVRVCLQDVGDTLAWFQTKEGRWLWNVAVGSA